ncbi:hypothetical protein A2U01_0095620, partial [Trifolium medium]|nr:hypothetical protein [Trifolium medium]
MTVARANYTSIAHFSVEREVDMCAVCGHI